MPLFNGKNPDGWDIKITCHQLNEYYKNTFRIEDSMLRIAVKIIITVHSLSGVGQTSHTGCRKSDRRGNERSSFFTEKDITFTDSAGFDHISLPADEQQLWDSAGNRYDDAFQLLDSCLNWANRVGLRVVLDLHILRSHHFLCTCWSPIKFLA